MELGWRESTIDADLHADEEGVFRGIQSIKEPLRINVEFADLERFVPPLKGSEDRHVLVETIGRVSFYHYDPYAQLLSKLVRGFRQDLQDAAMFLSTGMVDAARFRSLVAAIPQSTYARYPALSRAAAMDVVDAFLEQAGD